MNAFIYLSLTCGRTRLAVAFERSKTLSHESIIPQVEAYYERVAAWAEADVV